MECLYEKYERKNLVTTCLGLLTRPNLRWPLFYRKITEITIKYELIYLELQFWCLNVGLEGQGLVLYKNFFSKNAYKKRKNEHFEKQKNVFFSHVLRITQPKN